VVRTHAATNALQAAAEPQLSRKPLKPAVYKWLGSALGGDGSGAIKSRAEPAVAEPATLMSSSEGFEAHCVPLNSETCEHPEWIRQAFRGYVRENSS